MVEMSLLDTVYACKLNICWKVHPLDLDFHIVIPSFSHTGIYGITGLVHKGTLGNVAGYILSIINIRNMIAMHCLLQKNTLLFHCKLI